MAEAVDGAARTGTHLLVQAGTGTGKSLAYLVPALSHAVRTGQPVVVSTATLALQAQVVDRDLPRVADALTAPLGRRPTWQLVKGRRNYVCPHKLDGGFPADDDTLFELGGGDGPAAGGPGLAGSGTGLSAAATSRLGAEVVRLREWAQSTTSGDRDELVPGVTERAWRQVSVSARECLGAQRCPQAAECFCEQARERAKSVDVVVANHALVAIDAFEGRSMLPDHELLIVDEAHELADRVTSVISQELTGGAVEAATRRARKAGCGEVSRLEDAGAMLDAALAQAPEGRHTERPVFVADAVGAVRDAARDLVSALKGEPGAGGVDGGRQQARAAVTEIFDVADRLAGGGAGPNGPDVVWVSRFTRFDGVVRVALHVAPLSVAGLLRQRLFGERTVVATSATLAVGGDFDAAARAVGLSRGGGGKVESSPDDEESTPSHPLHWTALDVGSPFDYPRQAILYIAKHLPPPGREPLSAAVLDELAALIEAAGGRALGLFSSRRASQFATEAMRERLDLPVLCQGDDATPTLVRQFAGDARTCLFGTLSLWQGVDVPGSACQLVVVDRIPFPRPDDPLMTARQQAVARNGGNGFMAVAATHAALLLAQGVGRLIRTGGDRGVVAVLDSRLATARYASYLRASLPPFWATTEPGVALEALRRIDASAPAPLPVGEGIERCAPEQPPGRRPGPATAEGPTPSPAGTRSGISAGRGWTPEEDAGLRAALDAGRPVEVLAERYACSVAQITARITDLHLDTLV